jgi:hypothetical protein
MRSSRRYARRAPFRAPSIALLLLSLLSVAAAAQNATTGAIRGRVTGSEGSAVSAAQISAVNEATGFTRRVVSSENGDYAALMLPPGRYALRVQRLGFRPLTRDSILVRISEVATLDLRLESAAAQLDAITVSAAEDRRVDTRQTGVAEYVSEREIQRLPALGRDFTDFIALSGLVSPIPEVSTGGTFAVGGGRTSGVNVQIDGADGNFNFFGESRGGARIPFTFSLESIREFQLITNGYDAEFGNYSSAVVNVVTRGGTNDFRGSALAYWRDDKLTNSGFAFPGDTARRPNQFEVQQYALSYSGPIVRDKLHFLVSLDGQRRRDPFEAATPRALGVGQATIDRFTSALENTYGLAGAHNEFGAFRKTDDVNVLFGRLDWTANAANRLSLRANYANYKSQNDGLQFGGSRPRTNGSSFTDKNLSIVGEGTTVLSPTAFNVLRLQLADEKRPRISNNFLPAITVLDVEGTNDIFYGSSGITFRNDLDERKLQLIDNVTKVQGAHTLKLGTNNLFSRIYNQFWLNGNGSYEFASMADFEARTPSRFTRNVPLSGPTAPVTTFNMGELAFYAQDEWQVTNKLLATFGLRYDISVYGDDFSSVQAVDTLFANRNEAFRTGEAPIDKNNLSPRVSIAYDVRGDRTHVLRAGAGLFYGRVPGVLGSNVGIGDDPVLSLDCRTTAAPAPNFSAFGAHGENIPFACAGGSSALGGTREYAFWSKGFEYPETFKSSVGYEWRATQRTSLAADLLWGRTSKNFTVTDATLPLSPVATVAAEGNRAIYVPLAKYNPRNAAATADRSRFAGINRIYVNDNQGVAQEFAATFRVDQRIGRGQLRVSYTYNMSKDNGSFVCCTNSEGLFGDATAGNLNDKGIRNGPNWGNSRFVRPHTFIVSGLTDLPYGFSLSGIFRANSGTFYTPSVSGDMNGDGNTGNDLPFIGRPEDMLFQTPADQATYTRLLDENTCLRDAIGTIVKRNSCPNPWMYQFDMSAKKAFFGRGDGRQIEVVADFFNVLNGLNSRWGQLRRVGQTRVLSAQAYDATTGKVRYTANTAFGDESFIGPVRQFQTQLGLRVAF